jgi:nickel/cobalt transporter (NiCoT) family protein
METHAGDWFALVALAFTLGLKHGLDADHLATIDGLTRFNVRERPAMAPWCGALFSLGHGAVVVAIAVTVGTVTRQWQVPAWVGDLGAWISIVFLCALGLLNLATVLRTDPAEVVHPVGLKSGCLARLQQTDRPWLVAAVGALFALSFDSMSQAALFALMGTQFGSWLHAAALGFAFMFGMLVTDGVNGLWISRLISRADSVARIASRTMGLAVAGLSLLVAAFGAARYFSPALGAWTDGKELTIGIGVIALLGSSFLIAVRLARPALPARSWSET